MSARVLKALGLWVMLAGCVSVPRPSVEVEGRYGLARAEDRADAHMLARLLDKHLPSLRELLPDAVDVRAEVWLIPRSASYGLVRSIKPGGLLATSDAERIQLQRPLVGGIEDILVHELVHQIIGPSWAPLPAFLQEGLADLLAVRLSAERDRTTGTNLVWAAEYLGRMQVDLIIVVHREDGDLSLTFPVEGPSRKTMDLRSLLAIDQETIWRLMAQNRGRTINAGYGMGFLVVSRIVEREGLEGLNAYCRRASEQGLKQVPSEWLIAAAGLPADVSDWVEIVRPELSAEHLAGWARWNTRHVIQSVRMNWGFLEGHGVEAEEKERWETQFTLRLALTGSNIEVELAQLPEIHELLVTKLGDDARKVAHSGSPGTAEP